MSIHPINFNSDNSIEVYHDEYQHGGIIVASDIVWVSPYNIESHDVILLKCPGNCGYSSGHPVSGGADAPNVQKMFINKTTRDGCACGQVNPNDNSALPESHVRLNCNRMDGPGRWQASEPSAIELFKRGVTPLENAPNMFQVVYRKSDNLIVGLEPAGGVGPDNSVGVIHDLDEYEVLMQTDPAYLSADGDHIVGTSPNAA